MRLEKGFHGEACATWLGPGTGLLCPGASAQYPLPPPPAARYVDRHGQPRVPSAALVVGRGPQDRPTLGLFCRGSVGLVLIDRPRWDPPLDRPSEGRVGPCVPGPYHSRGGPSPGGSGADAPGGGLGQRSTYSLLALLRPGWRLRPKQTVDRLPRGAPSSGAPRHHIDPGGLLRGTARRQRRVPGGPPGALRGSTPLWLADDAMREGEPQGR